MQWGDTAAITLAAAADHATLVLLLPLRSKTGCTVASKHAWHAIF